MARLRLWRYVVLTLALTLLAIAVAWFLWVPAYRPGLRPGEGYGVDVSHHQGSIDWPAVAGDEIAFAYIKATEGMDHTDQRFAENWAGAKSAGLERGAYHFFTLCSPGREQARHFVSVAPPESEALAPAVDLELAGNCAARPARERVLGELRSFLAAVEEGWGAPTLLYLGDDFEERYRVRDELDRPLWLRRLLRRPVDSEWLVWQIWGYARINGIAGRVDLDVMRT